MMNIMNPPADWSTMKKLIWLRGTPINGGEELTVSGTPPLSLPNSLGKPLKAWSVDLLPYQEGTGDPAPDNVRPIHGTNQISFITTGKNLIQNTATSRTNSGVTYTIGEHGIVTLSGTATATSWMRGLISDSDKRFLHAGQYHLSGGISNKISLYIVGNYKDGTSLNNSTVQGGVYDQGNGLTFTLTQDAYLNYQVQVNNGIDASGIIIKPMIEVGTGTGEFEPFDGTTSVLTLPQTVYAGTIGSEGGESRTAAVDLGTLDYYYVSSGDVNAFRCNIGAMPVTDNNQHGVTSIYPFAGTRFTANMPNPSWMIESQGRLFIRDDRYSDVSSFKEYLSGQKLVYELATPVQFPLTSPTIPTPTGTATTWATAEDGTVDGMEVTYVGKA